MSIRYKLLILLTTLTATSLALFLLLATNLFKEDKIAYIFDSSAAYSKSLAYQVKSEIVANKNLIKYMVLDYGLKKEKFSDYARAFFNSEDNLISLYAIKGTTPEEYTVISSFEKKPQGLPNQKELDTILKQLAQEIITQDFSFRILEKDENNYFIFGLKANISAKESLIIVTITKGEGLYKFIKQSQLYDSYVIQKNGKAILGSLDSDNHQKDFSNWKMFEDLSNRKVAFGTMETVSPEGETILTSYSEVGIGNLQVISNISKKEALRAVDLLLIKAALFFMALVSVAVFISVLASKTLTKSLEKLSAATKKVSEGDFSVKLDIKSKDEVGILAASFNKMTSEVLRLMNENIQKARMEKELETAKIVQSTLFPPNEAELENVKISGYFEPASECGGDWWYYFKLGGKVYVLIGDVTGHGAPAALITSAARSAISLLEQNPQSTPKYIGQMLNKAIFDTSRGKINMTFVVACIDPKEGTITYLNASHEKPMKAQHISGKAITMNDLIPLLEGEGPRLGEKIESEFTEFTEKLESGDILFFYTDGLTDIPNKKGEKLSENAVLKSFATAVSKTGNTTEIIKLLKKDMESFNQGTPLYDDVTFFVCKYQ